MRTQLFAKNLHKPHFLKNIASFMGDGPETELLKKFNERNNGYRDSRAFNTHDQNEVFDTNLTPEELGRYRSCVIMEYGNLKKYNFRFDNFRLIFFVTINSVADTELRHLENVFSHNIQDVSSSRRELLTFTEAAKHFIPDSPRKKTRASGKRKRKRVSKYTRKY
jgi:hypothetical protein